MAIVKPFKAWRPQPDIVEEVASVPYDVVNTEEAKKLAEGKPNSFLHVIRPEIDLPKNISLYHEKVYKKGQENLESLIRSETFTQEKEDALYLYRLTMEGISQTGVFGCLSVEEYENEVILKHELTRPDKEDDRTKHILTQQAHAEPVMITFKDSEQISDKMESIASSTKPIYDLETEDGIQHTVWKIENSSELETSFKKISHLYIADGHHRCASAARAAKEKASQNPNHDGSEEYNFFPAVIFPMQQMKILAYNRIIFSIPNDFLDKLDDSFHLIKDPKPRPVRKGEISLYLEGNWFGIRLETPESDDPASSLDVSRLQQQILGPILGIKDQRTDPNIDFVGGIRGTEELEQIVDNGEAALGISMFPTSIQELIDVSDAGQLMPPKSTWFEPKLRSGLLIHTF